MVMFNDFYLFLIVALIVGWVFGLLTIFLLQILCCWYENYLERRRLQRINDNKAFCRRMIEDFMSSYYSDIYKRHIMKVYLYNYFDNLECDLVEE